MEKWKDIKGFEGYYQISNIGRVKSLERFSSNGKLLKLKILKPCKTNFGYSLIRLRNDEGIKQLLVHRIVAEHFLINPKCKRTVNHKNGIKTDNRISNIEWATYGENHKHAYKNGLRKSNKGKKYK